MSDYRLTQVDIEYFRGATTPCSIQFDKTKPLVVVFGENGTGKSTLVDAFELIAKAEIGTIRDRSSATNKHAPAIGKKATDIKVTLHRDSDKWYGTMRGTKINVSPLGNRPQIVILRRTQLLGFVESKPSERYKVLQRFIDVQGVESSEKAALDALNAVKRENVEAINKKLAAEAALSDLWETNGSPDDSWRAWAVSKIELSTTELEEEVKSVEAVLEAIHNFQSQLTAYDISVDKFKNVKSTLETIEKEIERLSSEWSKQTPSLISILVATTALLDAAWTEESCPVCNQGIMPDELRVRVSENLTSLNDAKAVYERQQTAQKDVAFAASTLETEKTKLVLQAKSLVEVATENEREEITALSISLTQLKASLEEIELAAEKLAQCIDDCERIADLWVSLDGKCNVLNRDKNQLHTIKREYANYKEGGADSIKLDGLSNQLEKIHSLVSTQRIEFIQEILDSVASEVSRLYEVIHPDEDTKAGGLRLDPKKRASLHQFAEFAGKSNIEPQGYFSDSHLDTLGFCYWLALAMRENPESKIVVLDDVFTSVDAPHLMRIIELIDNECGCFAQFFAITHSRNWRNQYAFNRAAGGKTHLIELLRWNPVRGITHDCTELEIDKLQQLLDKAKNAESALARQEICNQSGVLLEAIFDQLSSQYRCSIPRSADGNYTLADLINSCTKLMKKLQVQHTASPQLTDQQEQTALLPVGNEFNAVKETAFIRNLVGCHYNEAGAELTDVEIEEFGNSAVLLARAIVCPKCGEVPRSNKSTHRLCSCKHTRLVPAIT